MTPQVGNTEPAEDRMSIIERRLAEIQGKASPAAAEAAPAASAATDTAAAGSTQVEMPGQGTEPRPATEPAGAGTAEHTAEATPELTVPAPAPADAMDQPEASSLAPDAGTPEAAAAAETAHHVPDAVTVDGHDMSAPQARATAHYGVAAEPEAASTSAIVSPVAPESEALSAAADEPVSAPAPEVASEISAEPLTSTAPALVADPENSLDESETAATTVEAAAPATPEANLTSSAELEAAPAPVASLPTSSDTPLPTAETAADTAHIIEADAADATAADADDATEAGEPSAEPAADMPDFTALDLPAQVTYLVQLLRAPNAARNRKQILDLTRQYEANVGLARSAARQKFADGGADAEAFAFQQPEGQQELNKALQEFRASSQQERKAEDASRTDNLTKKKALLDQLRELVEAAETKDSSGKLKTLQTEWKNAGPVPQADSQSTWDTYHGLLDIYYSKQGRFLELKDLDRRRNLEAKEALIKRAEALASAPGINKALDELTKLHEDWKSIGPVPNDQREPLWQRFIAASDVLHQRRKVFSDERSVVEKANLEVKKALLDRILPFAEFETDRVNLWRSKTDEIQEIKQEWEAAGQVPRKQADELNKQLLGGLQGVLRTAKMTSSSRWTRRKTPTSRPSSRSLSKWKKP